jgi:hypothetical protein
MNRRVAAMVFGTAFAAVLGACSPDDDVSAGDGGCTTTSCYSQCLSAGYPGGGFCQRSTCVCEGAADADADGDGDADVADDGSRPDVLPTDMCDLDLLFVVDTSGSMFDAAEALRTVAFPNFADELERYPSLGTYRVAFKNHLYGEHEITSDGPMQQDSLFMTMGWPPGDAHDPFNCEEAPSIDCAFASGQSWMEGPAATLRNEFACVGSFACHQDVFVGEPTLQAGLEGLRFPDNAAFLREGALLVAVFISDEEDQSPMTATALHDGLLALKGGDERYVVALTLGGPEVGTVEVNSMTHAMGCISDQYGGTEQTPKMIEFSRLFGTRGLHYNLCDDDISTALTSAINALEMSCDEIILL